MDMNKTVCTCYGVTIGDLKEAIENGAGSFDEVQEITNVSTACGSCEEYARNVVEELLKEQES
ncbi:MULTISPECIES: (2Fe-2S)-binding protein [Diplocloster]|uniref:Bacterioferritin-associated ferredoxin n=1 Tax=Diplocloster modestus TaxID=2850322 RepID=A0ABS6K8M3_9FIRM|nr:(2Fe-2S)-binding protein [Diplocloster modestus]MBU9726852.1 (2Fe-2S)-binding protein [Diplocloster modestus]